MVGKEYADRRGVMKKMKAEKQCEWISRMCNILLRIREKVNAELIYE
ncbi:TnpV protein [Veillonella montpellierensis]